MLAPYNPSGRATTLTYLRTSVSDPPGHSRIIIDWMAGTSRASARGIRARVAPDATAARILAIDYGRKRIGLALSDELGLTAQPLATLVRANRRDDLRRLGEICREYRVARILVGHPLHMTGAEGEMADEAARFAARLEKELGVVTELVDERLTTWEAQQLMAEMKSSSRRKRTHTDDVAAAVLLREYLDRQRTQPRSASAEKD
jgi:putative Holliday junction resolvase